MNRLLRTPALSVVLLALGATVAGACAYVQPPVMTITRTGESAPFFTLTEAALFAELDKGAPAADGAPTTTTSAGPYRTTADVTNLLRSKFRTEVWKELLKSVGTSVNQTDRQIAKQGLESQGGAAGDDALESQASSEAYGRGLAEEAFRTGRLDPEVLGREYYDRNPAAFSTPAQLCVHVMGFVVGDPNASPPTEADYAATLAQVNAARARLANETFETVADEVSYLRDRAPGGALGCQDETQLSEAFSPEDLQRLRSAAPGTVVDPLRTEGAYILFRVDEVKVAVTPPFDAARAQTRDLAGRSLGRQLANERLRTEVEKFKVEVDDRYGSFDAKTIQINAPEPALTPTTPTTPTTTPQLAPVPAPAEPAATPTTTAPAATPGSTPGTTPATTSPEPAGSAGTTASTARR